MADHHEEVANKVVEAFKAALSDTALEHITPRQFEALAATIREVLSQERAQAAELVEDVVRKLRADAKRRRRKKGSDPFYASVEALLR